MTMMTTGCLQIDDLNDTLLESIFKRLVPSKHLAIARCVSKRWNSIITDPDFFRRLTHQHFIFSFFLVTRTDCACPVTEHPYFQRHSISLDFLSIEHYPNIIVGYHKDLLVSYTLDSKEGVYYIANPLTRQFATVRISKTCTELYNALWLSHMVGFAGVVNGVSTPGVTNSYNNNLGYRIVHINSSQESFAMIYSSQTGQWKFHPIESINHDFEDSYSEAVTLNDKLHWVGTLRILVIDPFDDDNVVPHFLNLPEDFKETLKESELGVCRNQLRIAHFKANPETLEYPRIKVWEFTNYDDDLATLKSHKIAELRLVIDFTLEQTLIDSVFYSFGRMCPTRYLNEDGYQIICCHPNDPDLVYFTYRSALVRCDVVRRKLKFIVPLEQSSYRNPPLLLMHPYATCIGT